jgi:hypothetical protein
METKPTRFKTIQIVVITFAVGLFLFPQQSHSATSEEFHIIIHRVAVKNGLVTGTDP